jgi:ABC-2 type transport system ATP-binding protein
MSENNCLKMLIGISTPTSGEAVVAGYNVKSATEMVKKSIGYMSQKSPCMMT